MTTPAIEAIGLVKKLGDLTAVGDVSFTVPQGTTIENHCSSSSLSLAMSRRPRP